MPYTIAAMNRIARLRASAECPCDSGARYIDCCGPLHAGLSEGIHAPEAEALMRSRYSAYTLGLGDYLLLTWHPSTAPGDLELPPLKWLGLEIWASESSGEAAVVEFVARYREAGRAGRLHEISRFVREHGRWYYIDGAPGAEDPQ